MRDRTSRITRIPLASTKTFKPTECIYVIMNIYWRISGFGDEISEFFDPIVDVEPPPPLNWKISATLFQGGNSEDRFSHILGKRFKKRNTNKAKWKDHLVFLSGDEWPYGEYLWVHTISTVWHTVDIGLLLRPMTSQQTSKAPNPQACDDRSVTLQGHSKDPSYSGPLIALSIFVPSVYICRFLLWPWCKILLFCSASWM